MKKKILALLLAGTLLFTACSKTDEKKPTEESNTVSTEETEEQTQLKAEDLEKMRAEYEVEVDELKADDFSKDSTMHSVLKNGKLVLATNATYPPFEFRIMVDGKADFGGIDMELGLLLAKKMGVELEIVDTSFESLITGLSNEMYDLVLAGMNKDPERDKAVDFSEDYYFPTLVLLQRKDELEKFKTDKDIPDDFIFGNQTGTVQEKVTQVKFPKTLGHALYMENYTELILALQTKNIDGLLIEDIIANAFVANNDDLAINENITYPGETGFAAAFKDGDKEFQEYIDAFIEEIKGNGTLEKIEQDGTALSIQDM